MYRCYIYIGSVRSTLARGVWGDAPQGFFFSDFSPSEIDSEANSANNSSAGSRLFSPFFYGKR